MELGSVKYMERTCTHMYLQIYIHTDTHTEAILKATFYGSFADDFKGKQYLTEIINLAILYQFHLSENKMHRMKGKYHSRLC